jgi:hypothetical protein
VLGNVLETDSQTSGISNIKRLQKGTTGDNGLYMKVNDLECHKAAVIVTTVIVTLDYAQQNMR